MEVTSSGSVDAGFVTTSLVRSLASWPVLVLVNEEKNFSPHALERGFTELPNLPIRSDCSLARLKSVVDLGLSPIDFPPPRYNFA